MAPARILSSSSPAFVITWGTPNAAKVCNYHQNSRFLSFCHSPDSGHFLVSVLGGFCSRLHLWGPPHALPWASLGCCIPLGCSPPVRASDPGPLDDVKWFQNSAEIGTTKCHLDPTWFLNSADIVTLKAYGVLECVQTGGLYIRRRLPIGAANLEGLAGVT